MKIVSRLKLKFQEKKEIMYNKKKGILRRLMGVIIEAKEINVSKSINLSNDKDLKIGELRSGVYSPHFKKVIGIFFFSKTSIIFLPTFPVAPTIAIFMV